VIGISPIQNQKFSNVSFNQNLKDREKLGAGFESQNELDGRMREFYKPLAIPSRSR